MKRALLVMALSAQLIFVLGGCAKLGGGLRRDFDDGTIYSQGPTTGGRWTEKGLLEEEEGPYGQQNYAAVGHAERSPASAGSDPNTGTEGWGSREALTSDQGVSQRLQETMRKPKFKTGSRARRADFIDESTNEGSLWAPEGQTNYYFSKNKIRSVGDIVTVTLDEQIVKDVATEIRRTLVKQEAQIELGIAQERLIAKRQGAVAETAAAPAGSQKEAAAQKETRQTAAFKKDSGEIPEPTFMDIELGSALEIKPTDSVMAEVVERYPNGNYKIRGTKKVLYKNGAPRLVTIVAIAKGADISEEDVVSAGKLYEYRLEATR